MELGSQKADICTEYCSSSSRDSNEENGAPAIRSSHCSPAKSKSILSETSRTKECSMCGDVGFDKELFQCKSCLLRYQHTYCSSLYPKLDLYNLSCEWCIYFKGRQIRHPNNNPGGRPPEKLKAKTDGSPLKLLLEAVEAHGTSEFEMELLHQNKFNTTSSNKGSEIFKKRQRNSSACSKASIPRHGPACSDVASSPRAARRPRGSGEEKPAPNIEDESVNRRNNHSGFALERWRQITKNKVQNASASSSVKAASGRRYKLLADFFG